MKGSKVYDCLIIGTGPAGYTASIYLSRYQLSNLLIGKQPGGTITLAHLVENFPGIPSVSGLELAQRMADQVKKLGAEIIGESVARIEKVDQLNKLIEENRGEVTGKGFRVTTETNKEYFAKSVILATGTERRKLNIPGEDKFLGKGISYCTNCDAPFFKDKVVAIIGGSDAAVSGAIHLTSFAKKVYLIYRGEQLRAEAAWVEQAIHDPKIEVIYKTNIVEIIGHAGVVRGIRLDNKYNNSDNLAVDGVFIEIGGVPASSFLASLGLNLTEGGYVVVDERMQTNIPGIMAAGDFTTQSLIMSQAIVACGQGAVAAGSIFKYIKGQPAPQQLGTG